jgi:hypothetical protein
MGLYRGRLDYADSMRDELGPSTGEYSDRELSRGIEMIEMVGFGMVKEEDGEQGVKLSESATRIGAKPLRIGQVRADGERTLLCSETILREMPDSSHEFSHPVGVP